MNQSCVAHDICFRTAIKLKSRVLLTTRGRELGLVTIFVRQMNLDEFRYMSTTHVVSILFLCTHDWNFAINHIFKRFGFVCVFAFMCVEFERLLDACEKLIL